MTEAVGQDERVNILLVDDRPANVLSLSAILERPDYNLVPAYSGLDALSLVLRQEFALILLDVAMPGMDGFEVASTIRQRERFRAVPIIFVTASIQHIEWIFKAYSVGAVDFLHKPLDPHAVRAKVAVFVELYRQKQQLRRHAAQLQELERRERAVEVERVRIVGEERYRHLAESIPHVVWTADAGGEVEYFNHRWFEITGLAEKNSLGSGWRAAVHPQDRVPLAEKWEHGLQEGKAFEVEFRLRKADGAEAWYLARALPERDGASHLARWIGTLTDVDESKRAHRELESAIALRDEFISVASHELRTPLSTLQLQLQGLQRLRQRAGAQEFEKRVEQKLGMAIRQTDRLARLIQNLLDVTRLSQKKFELQLESFDLTEMVRDVVERFREEAGAQGSAIDVSLDTPVPGQWDRLRMDQAVTNLVTNAIKYGEGKQISVSVKGDGEEAAVAVHDQGIGVSAEDAARIFEPFERGVSTRHFGGLGLGLYIVRQIARAHGGDVHVESQPGQGSRFVLSVPRRPPETQAQPIDQVPAPVG